MQIDLHLGRPGNGKTYEMIRKVIKSGRPACIYTPPDPKKKDELSKLDHVSDTEEFLSQGIERYFLQRKIFCVHWEGNSEVFFEHFDLRDCWLVLDDYPTLCGNFTENQLVKRILPMLRRAGVDMIVTAHTLLDDIPGKLRKLSTGIFWFGPCDDPDEKNALLKLRQGDALMYDRENFKERLENIENKTFMRIR